METIKLNLSLGEPQAYQNLTVYPLLGELDGNLSYLTLDEALDERSIEIKEVGGGGSVSELLLINHGQSDVLILSGEELFGAKQNRAINVTIMASAGTSLKIPVSCTEKGRWCEGTAGIRVKHTSAHYSTSHLRRGVTQSVNESLKAGQSYRSNQETVWETIGTTMRNFGVSSDTMAQSDIFVAKKDEIESYVEQFRIYPEQVGMIGLIDGKVACLDLFGKADTFYGAFPKLLRSYAVDAILKSNNGKRKKVSDDVEKFVKDLTEAKVERQEALGKGEHLVLAGKLQKGVALVVDGNLVHLCSFPN